MKEGLAKYEITADIPYYFSLSEAKSLTGLIHLHNSMEMIFVTQGEVTAKIHTDTYNLKKGDIAVVNSFEDHYYKCSNDAKLYLLLISEGYFKRFVTTYGKKIPTFLPYKESDSDDIFKILRDFFDRREVAEQIEKLGFVDMLLGRIASAYTLEDISENLDDNFAVRVMSYIENHYKEKISLGGVASFFGYSKNYFSMLFNKHIGMNFKQYVNQLRYVKVSDAILKGDKRSVLKIATEFGFDDIHSYYKLKNKFANK